MTSSRSPSAIHHHHSERPGRDSSPLAIFTIGIWHLLLVAIFAWVLFPLDAVGSSMKTAAWLGAYPAAVAGRLYGLIRVAMPWMVVGTSGSASDRCAVPTATAATRLSFTNAIAELSGAKKISTRPAMMSVSASDVPR